MKNTDEGDCKDTDEAIKPEVSVRAPSFDEEVERVRYYNAKGVTTGVVLPDGVGSIKLPLTAIREIMQKEYYPRYYDKGLDRLNQHSEAISESLAVLMRYKEAWGFELEPDINIRLTRYGKAGSYYMHTKEVILKTDSEGNFGSKNPASDAVHEITHFAIEHLIQKYKVPQSEKERIVDILCATMYPELFEKEVAKLGAAALETYRNALDRLPEVFESNFGKNEQETS